MAPVCSLVRWGALALLLAPANPLHAQRGRVDAPPVATFVVRNATIMTMDPRTPRAEAMTLSGERIIAVGTEAQIAPLIGPTTRVLDVNKRLVIPGFNDSHVHFSGGASLLRAFNLYDVRTLAEVQRMVAEKVKNAKPGEWITGSRYDHTLWGTAWPTKEDLDKVAPNNPVVGRYQFERAGDGVRAPTPAERRAHAPLERLVEPLDPMRGVFSAVTRTNIQRMEPTEGWLPEQKLSVWESIYYYTYGSAYADHLENEKGSLAAGRLGDFIVMDRNLFTIPPAQILDAKVDYTIVGGEIVWDRKTGRFGRTKGP